MVASQEPTVVRQALALRDAQRARYNDSAHEPKPQLTLWPEKFEWPEDKRGVPNAWLRGALFAAILGKERRPLKREAIPTIGGIEIRFTGWQLTQSDLDVWEAVINLSRDQNSFRVEFSAHAMLLALQRNTGKSEREWLKDVFARLSSASVEITSGRFTYFGALLKGARDEISGRYIVELDSRLLAMYEAGHTWINWEQRQKLRRKPLAQWLHGWLSSHAKPHPIRVETIREISGSRNRSDSDFRRRLREAIRELESAGAIRSGRIENGLVHIASHPTPSQARHLQRRDRIKPVSSAAPPIQLLLTP